MKEIKSVNEGVKKIFSLKGADCPEFDIEKGQRYDSLIFNGEKVPLLYARYNTKHSAMKDLDIVGKACALTGYYVAPYALERMFFYEMTCCEWIVNSTINKAKCYINDKTANLMLSFKNEATAFIQLHAASFGDEEFKHELFSSEGMVADMAVDNVVRQRALNVFLPEGREFYTDSDNELYGLKQCDVDRAYCIYNTFTKDVDEIIKTTNRLNKIIDLIIKSDDEIVEGVDF